MLMTTTAQPAPTTYATKRNSRFSDNSSQLLTVAQRWRTTYKAMPKYRQNQVDEWLASAKAEFSRRNRDTKCWDDLNLCEAREAILGDICIDTTMQRQLDTFWVIKIINNFCSTQVMPIQVYRNEDDRIVCWDGQHTLITLWLLATQCFDLDPNDVKVPVVFYKSKLKSVMRNNFIQNNSDEGKKQLDVFDIYEQQVYGVRIDGSKNPLWIASAKKQAHLEEYDLFVTSPKFGDEEENGAISRLQEINKMPSQSVAWLARYLSAVTQNNRPTEQKEIVMMHKYFELCRVSGIAVDDAYVDALAGVTMSLWGADFEPYGRFWAKAERAYRNWHDSVYGNMIDARFSREVNHGMPFLIAQLKKSLGKPVPSAGSSSPFVPDQADLF